MTPTGTTLSDGYGARYSRVAMALHWTVALLIFVQLGTGWWLNEWVPDHSPQQDQIQWWHVSFGMTLLLLVVLRIIWRLMHRPPPPVPGLSPWERNLSSFVHVALYVLMLAQPLVGWALLTARGHHPPSFFGLALPFLPGIPRGGHALSDPLKHLHIYWMIWAYVGALALHVAGALKHQFDGHPVLWRMVPFLGASVDRPTIGSRGR